MQTFLVTLLYNNHKIHARGNFMNYMEQNNQETEKELAQFLFLCGKKDREILLLNNDSEFKELARLACISLVLGFKKMFLKITTIVENRFEEFLHALDILNENFTLLNEWFAEFINDTEYEETRKLLNEFWNERKKKLDCKDFKVKLLFDPF